MDIKKFLDQTVREVKREVNKKVLKVPEIEQKVYEATSNEPWGPHGTLMGDIAQATRNYNEYQMIMAILWKRLNDTGKNWRHVYKSLTVLEFLVANGAERIIDELREHAYQVQTLVDFQYMEAGGKDQGINVRKKAQSLVALLNDKERIREVRNKAAANRDKYRGVSSVGSFSKSSSYSSTGGGYGDRDQDDDRYGGSSRAGGRDDDRYGGDRDRDRDRDDRYRDDDRSTRDSAGDRYRDERDRERFEDDRYAGKGGDGYNNDRYGDDTKYESSASAYGKDRERDRNYEEDDRYPPRRGNSGGSKADDYPHDDREPSGLAAAVARAHTSQTIQSQTSSNSSQGTERKAAPSVGGSYFASQPTEEFDDFDPRATSLPHQGDDLFGASSSAPAPALVPVSSLSSSKSTSGIEDLFGDSSFETSFSPLPAPVSNSSHQGNVAESEDIFGSSTFSVTEPSQMTFAVPTSTVFPSSVSASAGFAPAAPGPSVFAPPAAVNGSMNGRFQAYASVSSNDSNTSFGTSPFLGGSSGIPNSQPQPGFLAQPQPQASFLTPPQPQASFLAPPQPQASFLTQPQPPTASYSSTNSFQTASGATQPPSFPFTAGPNSQLPYPQVPGGNSLGFSSNTNIGNSQVPPTNKYFPPTQKPQQKSFQTKSTIWNDTISSGLVDLNISGPKTNPLAELGIDLKDSIFSAQEKRKEEKAQPTAGNMGRAMGSGTGLGLAGAGGIAPPPPPSMMGGMNMGVGMGMMRQPSMGMAMGTNPGYGIPQQGPGVNAGYGVNPGMGINPGYGVNPGMGMAPGMGMNPGMGAYGPGMGMVQGVYGPGLGLGGYPNQQFSGYR